MLHDHPGRGLAGVAPGEALAVLVAFLFSLTSDPGAIGVHRTIINLTQEDQEWLAKRARPEQVPVTELVRRAIRLYPQRSPDIGAPSFQELTQRTAGIWEGADGLAY